MNRKYHSIRSNIVAAAGSVAFIAFAVAPTAFADAPDPSATRSGNVSLSGLDLTQTGDVQIARERIRQQAVKLCDRVRDTWSLSQHQAFLECVDHVTASAEPTLAQLSARMSATRLASAQR